MSWTDFSSLSSNPENWGMKKRLLSGPFKIAFECVLRRCGRFLKHLVFDDYFVDIYIDSDIIKFVRRECPNLQDIHVKRCKCIMNREEIRNIKPIFNKVTKFNCTFEKLGLRDLDDLFSVNDKLIELKIETTRILFGGICDVRLIF